MVTASHNPVKDNGLKMVDPSGGMLDVAWEAHAAKVAAVPAEAVGDALAAVAATSELASTDDDACAGALVIIGRDTRPTSAHLADLVVKGAEAVGAGTQDGGVVSTPQLHFLVAAQNGSPRACETTRLGGLEPTLDCYFARLAAAYTLCLAAGGAAPAGPDAPVTVIDAADGVGGPQADRVAKDLASTGLRWEVRNAGGPGSEAGLNDGCGAEFVQKGRCPPRGVSADTDAAPGSRLCSLDGDADRVVFHAFVSGTGGVRWELVDGDKLAALLAVTVGALAKRCGGEVAGLSMGVVQTAYANGAATKWVTARGLTVRCAKTGVKFVHHAAEAFDVGVYFEANGHGTVVFSAAAQAAIDAAADGAVAADAALLGGSGAAGASGAAAAALAGGADAGVAVEAAVGAMTPEAAAVVLQGLTVLINQFVGDAVADALACEAALRIGGAGIEDWVAMYADLPSRQTKVRVADRLALTTTPDESRLVEPAALQAAIDAAVAEVDASNGRAFVRPSGTEDVVRVYAEAATVADADRLAAKVAQAVYDLAGGVGDRPCSSPGE